MLHPGGGTTSTEQQWWSGKTLDIWSKTSSKNAARMHVQWAGLGRRVWTLSSVSRRSLLLWHFLDDCDARHRWTLATQESSQSYIQHFPIPSRTQRILCLKQDTDIERKDLGHSYLSGSSLSISLINSYAKTDAFLIRRLCLAQLPATGSVTSALPPPHW